MLLGEVQSKCEHIASIPLQPEIAQRLHQLFLAKGALATTAIEGNTLSEDEVVRHLEGKLKLPPSKEYLGREIDNIVQACNRILTGIAEGRPAQLDLDRIREFDRQVLDGLELGTDVVPGEIRQQSAGVALYRGAPAPDCEYLIDRLCKWLNSKDFDPPAELESRAVACGIIKAVFAHLYLAWIHPFGDGNGRTARLIEFLILVTSGIPSPAAHLLSNHYNQTRNEYYRQLERASASGGDVLPFLEYAVAGFVDGLRAQLILIREQQWQVIWRDYVYEMFHDKDERADIRRRHLVLDLSAHVEPVPISKVHHISPRVAQDYASMTARTVSRDLKVLSEMGLVEIVKKTVRAKREQILAFLPIRSES